MNLYLGYTELWYTIEEGDGIDELYSWHGGQERDVTFTKLVTDSKLVSPYYEIINTTEDFKSGDTAYLVVVKYTTGDTFGYTSGNIDIPAIAKNEEAALKIALDIENKVGEFAEEKYRYPWQGYFEGLESVHVETMKVE